jgi:hypothetical protein
LISWHFSFKTVRIMKDDTDNHSFLKLSFKPHRLHNG